MRSLIFNALFVTLGLASMAYGRQAGKSGPQAPSAPHGPNPAAKAPPAKPGAGHQPAPPAKPAPDRQPGQAHHDEKPVPQRRGEVHPAPAPHGRDPAPAPPQKPAPAPGGRPGPKTPGRGDPTRAGNGRTAPGTPVARHGGFSAERVRQDNGPRQPLPPYAGAERYYVDHGRSFVYVVNGRRCVGYYYEGRRQPHWDHCCYNSYYECWLYFDAGLGTYFYWCGPRGRFYPVDYLCPELEAVDELLAANGEGYHLQPADGSEDYYLQHAVPFIYYVNGEACIGYYYPGQDHRHWAYCCYNIRLGCWIYFDPGLGIYYYWSAPTGRYYPVTYQAPGPEPELPAASSSAIGQLN